ncbi:MAG TPA: patatin family protein [Tissierellia bacterium]|nr:patatin family protein [Tissierellia bacterium]
MTSLVLEGGSLRGVYTAGVLDVLMENQISFDAVYGVSAGALNALNFLSGQPGRSARIAFEYVNDPRYMSDKNLQETGDYFGFSFLMGELSDKLIPFDMHALENNPATFYAVVTELETGNAVFLEKSDTDILAAAVASSSLPLISLPKSIQGVKYMDGGLACPIPFERALDDGAKKMLVVTTREKEFRKYEKPSLQFEKEQEHYREYPEFAALLKRTPEIYNRQLDALDALEKSGRVFVISPRGPVNIEPQERDVSKLKALYQEGRRDAQEQLRRLREYLQP